jgi:predicted nucleotidyltransferase
MNYIQNQQTSKNLSIAKENILAALVYFDIFSYPLTAAEIYLFLGDKTNHAEFNEALRCLVADSSVYHFNRYYTLQNDHTLVARRDNGNKKAAELIRIARKVANLLIKFPYVRGIAVSGSLSKNYADEYSDIDLFVITAENRLWIARTLMHAFKKLTFLVNRQDYFCMNYYIDEKVLQIAERNIYTAIEVVTLMPLQGDTAFEQFYSANQWTQRFLPNKIMRLSTAASVKTGSLKKFIELLFNNPLGNAIDNLCMKITAGRWHKKTLEKRTDAKHQIMEMDVNKHYSKPEPKNFQNNLLKKYHHKLAVILHTHQNTLLS